MRFVLEKYSGRIPEDTFPIADDEFDNLILISRKRGMANQVLFWDHEAEPKGGSLTFIAGNLRKFLDMLKEDEVIQYDMATVTFEDGESFRLALPANLFSVDRNAAIDIRDAKIGERIDDFGEIRILANVDYSIEEGVS